MDRVTKKELGYTSQVTSSTGVPLRPEQEEWPLSTPRKGEDLSGDVRPSNGRGLSKPRCQERGGARDDETPGRGQAFIDKNAGLPPIPGAIAAWRNQAAPRAAGAGWNPEPARQALRRGVRMEPAAGFLSPRPFPRASAASAPPAGPGPPASASPQSEPEVLAGPPAPDPGRLITDPRSGRTYTKGRLLGKVGRGSGVSLTEEEGSSAGPTRPLRSAWTDDAASSF